MNRVTGIFVLAFTCVGCEQPSAPPVGGAAPNASANTARLPPPIIAPASPEAATVSAPDVASQPPPVAEQSPPTPPHGASTVPSPAAAATPAIRLSTGIALAQTLPDGTGMLCSMDYQWTAGGPQPGVEYLWVIELGDGQRLSGPANLAKRNGTIEAVLRGIRPEREPFKGAVFAKSATQGLAPQRLSDFITLTK